MRRAILDIRRKKDLIFDQVNADTLLGTDRVAYGKGTHEPVRSFREYLAEHRDEITVLQVLHGSAPGRPTYAELKALAEQVARVPAIGSIETLWRAYAELGELADPSTRSRCRIWCRSCASNSRRMPAHRMIRRSDHSPPRWRTGSQPGWSSSNDVASSTRTSSGAGLEPSWMW
ncbi:hypothetical protein BTZ20_4127 [Rhodococcus sp. MTM3W5.2]|nr:hypothetical protein BTZ20_4127 [Rhodococcus sp. MTM3W5.2]